ncbi:RNA-directed DNA polymerase [Aneurinibacillus tyrosinisolvens]|uniref:RNA-directed DNA polymerase n=1 Tax=Aneurinibacillus tyrosinisolvens TaxID=1443435 RepID=UPI00063EF2FA|nr:RNA-directed DNA polymerase [Aneurinibacillus tyrosinisolvens]
MLKLQESSLDKALIHIEKFGDTDIFPVPFEFQAIRQFWETDIRPFIREINMLEWELRSFRRMLTPKHKYGFRISTQLDPIDSIIFTALVYEVGADLERARMDMTKNISFSSRFAPDDSSGRLYDPDYNWKAFQDYCEHLANSEEYEYVLVADIADFFPRIYSHPLEQALASATTKVSHVKSIRRCLGQLNGSVSYGIPVGQSGARLLAELVLDDVDRGLYAEGIKHCRFVDDFRIFCKSEREALQALTILANLLFENHGLTLQQHKTRVLKMNDFRTVVLNTEDKREFESLQEQFHDIIETLGLSNPYEEIEYSDLDEETQAEIDRMNLEEILQQHIEDSNESNDIDITLVRFILKRLTQIGNPVSVDLLIENIDKLYPVFKDVMKYFQSVNANTQTKHRIGEQLLELLNDSLIGHLDYNKMWILNTFTQDNQWNNEEKFAVLFNEPYDEYSQRKLILALGRSRQAFWFRSKRRSISQMNPWMRRAFLAAASCLPGDQAEHWYRSLPGLDSLDKVVTKWALQNRF